jgi:hypothetical protein
MVNVCGDLGEALANACDHLIPRGAFGHRPDLSPGPRHGGPTIASRLKEQHLKPLTVDVKFSDLAHGSPS